LASEAALELAYSKGLDLIVVAPNATPPVCKIMDLGKYQYEQMKRQKEARKKQVTVEMKEMKYRLRIDVGDLTVKNQHLKEFLSAGNRVRVTIMFRGREMAFPDQGRVLLKRVATDLAEYGTVTQEPKMQGRNMSMMMEPSKEVLAKMKGPGKE
jgi:translation initiation factor IF-3